MAGRRCGIVGDWSKLSSQGLSSHVVGSDLPKRPTYDQNDQVVGANRLEEAVGLMGGPK